MTTHIFPMTEVRAKMAGILERIHTEGGPCFVTKNGRATAVILSVETYDRLLSELEDRSDETNPALLKSVEAAEIEVKDGKFKTLDQIRWE